MLDEAALLLSHHCGLKVGSQLLWRTKWEPQQPLCLNCDDGGCQWAVCDHSIAGLDILLSTSPRDVFPLYLTAMLSPDKKGNKTVAPGYPCILGDLTLSHRVYISYSRWYSSRQLCSNAGLSSTKAHAAEELNDYVVLNRPRRPVTQNVQIHL